MLKDLMLKDLMLQIVLHLSPVAHLHHLQQVINHHSIFLVSLGQISANWGSISRLGFESNPSEYALWVR